MKTALIFPGQGSQVVGMGRDLQQNFPQVKRVFEEVNEALKLDLTKIMFEGPVEELTKTENTQPALMAVSIAIVRVLKEEFGYNIADLCSYVAGHSLGEYSALCAAEALTLEQTAYLLKVRGAAMSRCAAKSEGAMAAILGLDTKSVEQLTKKAGEGEICQVANDNSVGQVVISGQRSAISRATSLAKEFGAKRAIILPVGGAFHSELMADAKQEMKEALADIQIKKPIIPLIANVTADFVEDPSKIKDLLIEQITGSVKWRESLLLMQKSSVEQTVEIGSGKVLCGLVSKTCPDIKTVSVQDSQDLKSYLSTIELSCKKAKIL